VPAEIRKVLTAVSNVLLDIRFLDLFGDAMRRPSFPGQRVLGDSGENLPTVVQELCRSADRKSALVQWITELTPLDVVDFEFNFDATGRVLMLLKDDEGGLVSAHSASDGTLRFIAMAAALMGAKRGGVFFFEELDNGLHPSRMKLLIDLIEQEVVARGIQVVTTTHSPDLLNLVGDETFDHTSVVYRSHGDNFSTIKRVSQLPQVAALREAQSLGRLHSSGWFEDAVFFTAEDEAA
jgi:predicted ATPase